MNWYTIFYWLTVADNARGFFWFFAVVTSLIAIISMVCFFVYAANDEEKYMKWSRNWMWWSWPIMIIFWLGVILTPSKKDALLIVAGGGVMEFMTSDSTAKQLPHTMLVFVESELKAMAQDAKVEFLEAKKKLTQEDMKQKIRDEASKMTTQEVLDKMKADTTWANALLK